MTKQVWFVIAVAAVAAIVFVPAIGGPWIFDDHSLIEQNAHVHTLAAARSWFTSDFWSGTGLANRLQYWRPLVSASYAVDWTISSGNAMWFHVTNTAVHAAVGGLVFVTLRRWTSNAWAAFAFAVVWAVHPTKAENVAWISGRTDVLCAAFVLIALLGISRRIRGQRRSGILLEVAGTVAAYMCKEQAVVLPIFAAVEAWVAEGQPALDRSLVRPVIRAAWPQAVVAVLYVVLHAIWMPIAKPAGLGFVDHAQAVLETYGRFIALTFAPHQLSIQQGLVGVRAGSLVYATPYVVGGALAAIATIVAIIAARRRFPAVSVGLLAFGLTLAPTLNIIQTNQHTLVAERFLYIPSLGIALVLAAAVARLTGDARRRVFLLTGAVAVALAMLALSRSADFGNEPEFWNRELRLHPQSPAALEFVLTTAVQKHVLDEIGDVAERDKDQPAFAADVLEILAGTLTDQDPTALRDLETSCRLLLAPTAPTTPIHALGVTVSIETGPAYAAQLARVAHRIHIVHADLLGRLGDVADARAAAAAASDACGGCDPARVAIALAEARAAALGPPNDANAGFERALASAGTHDELRSRIADARKAAASALASRDAARLQARATELSAVGLWGPAYKVLEPRFGEIVRLSHGSTSLGKLAFRAGEIVDAVDALAATTQAEDLRPTLERWAAELGWLPATSAGGPRSP